MLYLTKQKQFDLIKRKKIIYQCWNNKDMCETLKYTNKHII